MSQRPDRRTLLGAGLVLLGLSGCGIRLEVDAPKVPVIPTRTPRPGESGVTALVVGGRDLIEVCSRWDGPGTARATLLSGLVTTQNATLSALLEQAGAPNPTSTPTGTGTGTATSTATGLPTGTATAGTGAPRATPATVGRTALGAANAVEQLAGLQARLAPTLVAVIASRVAWAMSLGQPSPFVVAAGSGPEPTEVSTASTTASATSTQGAGTLSPTSSAGSQPAGTTTAGWLEATRALRYAFEVTTARSAGAQRTAGRSVLEQIDVVEAEQLAALPTTAPPAAIGYDLPFPVTDQASARRLAATAATGLRAAYAAELGFVDPTPVELRRAAAWLAFAERLVIDWGGKPEPFPGLT